MVIGGCGSSGTTLLRHQLNRHPEIFCGPESTLFLARTTSADELARRFGFEAGVIRDWRAASPSKVAFIEAFQAACLSASGKRVWAEKTPENVRRFDQIARQFPRARFVHVVRDGRDVACSLRRARWMKLEKITRGADRGSPEALEACGCYWAERVRLGRRLAGRPNYHEVRYEDLVANPQAALRPLLAYLGVDWDARVLEGASSAAEQAEGPVFASSIGRWRAELSTEELALLDRHIGPLLDDLGYGSAPAWDESAPAARAA